MSDAAAHFGKFVPGFDFLKNLADLSRGASAASTPMAGLSNWIAPTLNVEDIDKRIDELKTVQFWLDANAKALGATIQALEVQKMTLATLKGMNFNMAEMAKAASAMASSATGKAAPQTPAPAPASTGFAPAPATPKSATPTPAAAAPASREPVDSAPPPATPKSAKAKPRVAAQPLMDPLQLWGALTQQFGQIAASAMKDVGATGPMAMAATRPAAPGGKTAKAASSAAKKVATKSVGTRLGAKKGTKSTPR